MSLDKLPTNVDNLFNQYGIFLVDREERCVYLNGGSGEMKNRDSAARRYPGNIMTPQGTLEGLEGAHNRDPRVRQTRSKSGNPLFIPGIYGQVALLRPCHCWGLINICLDRVQVLSNLV